MLVLKAIGLIALALAFRPQAQAAATWGELSLGKFYTYSAQPSSPYLDRWSNQYTSGARLTDEQTGEGSTTDKWVGWYGANLTITVDLGETYSISQIALDAQSRTGWGIYFPTSLTLATSTDGITFSQYGTVRSFPSNTTSYSRASVSGDGGWRSGRYVRFTVPSAGQWTFLDELHVYGSIPNTPKYVPSSGCYHGAYPTTTSDSYYLDIESFEYLAGKSTQMVLWYADWQAAFADNIGNVIDKEIGSRFLQVGFLPYNTTAASIAAGSHDTFLRDWFTDCKNKNHPIWIRAMNEMNGSWTFSDSTGNLKYGGDPQAYRWAWRRMVNIAQQVGCTGANQVFVWSPNASSSPSQSWNNMENYYPGDQYVDWVGVSAYNFNGLLGPSLSSLVQEVYNKYSANKYLMISEGGASLYSGQNTWISNWFSSIKNTYPKIKAAVWFHAQDGSYNLRIDASTDGLAAYQTGVADSAFLGNGQGVNVALRKSYSLAPAPSSSYPDTSAFLSDGAAPVGDASFSDATHVGWSDLNGASVTVVLDLGQTYANLNRFELVSYRQAASWILLPTGGSVEVSTNGINYTALGTTSFEPTDTSNTNAPYKLVKTSASPVSARYVKFTVNTAASSAWTMISEVRAYNDTEPALPSMM